MAWHLGSRVNKNREFSSNQHGELPNEFSPQKSSLCLFWTIFIFGGDIISKFRRVGPLYQVPTRGLSAISL